MQKRGDPQRRGCAVVEARKQRKGGSYPYPSHHCCSSSQCQTGPKPAPPDCCSPDSRAQTGTLSQLVLRKQNRYHCALCNIMVSLVQPALLMLLHCNRAAPACLAYHVHGTRGPLSLGLTVMARHARQGKIFCASVHISCPWGTELFQIACIGGTGCNETTFIKTDVEHNSCQHTSCCCHQESRVLHHCLTRMS